MRDDEMSENKNLSIEEIIKRAEKIKAEAERQLVSAEQNLNEKAKAAQEEISLSETQAAKRIAETFAPEEDEDVKEFVPSSEEEVKVFTPEKCENTAPEEVAETNDGKTRNIVLKKEDTVVVPKNL